MSKVNVTNIDFIWGQRRQRRHGTRTGGGLSWVLVKIHRLVQTALTTADGWTVSSMDLNSRPIHGSAFHRDESDRINKLLQFLVFKSLHMSLRTFDQKHVFTAPSVRRRSFFSVSTSSAVLGVKMWGCGLRRDPVSCWVASTRTRQDVRLHQVWRTKAENVLQEKKNWLQGFSVFV